jgi:hypothetical protein
MIGEHQVGTLARVFGGGQHPLHRLGGGVWIDEPWSVRIATPWSNIRAAADAP